MFARYEEIISKQLYDSLPGLESTELSNVMRYHLGWSDKDGNLAGAEWPLAFFDKNTNAVLTANEVELANFSAKKPGVLVDEDALLGKFDKNKDGQLSRDENATAHRDSDGDGVRDKDTFAFTHLDSDGDGKVNAIEAARTRWRVAPDSNKDFMVTNDELVISREFFPSFKDLPFDGTASGKPSGSVAGSRGVGRAIRWPALRARATPDRLPGRCRGPCATNFFGGPVTR